MYKTVPLIEKKRLVPIVQASFEIAKREVSQRLEGPEEQHLSQPEETHTCPI